MNNLLKISELISDMPVYRQKKSKGGFINSLSYAFVSRDRPPQYSFPSNQHGSMSGGGGGGRDHSTDGDDKNINDPSKVLEGTEKEIKTRIEALKDAIKAKVLSEKDSKDAQKVIDAYNKTLATIDLIKDSDHKYKIQVKPGFDNDAKKNSGEFTYDTKTGEYVITIEDTKDIGLISHELEHVNQLENGELTLGKDGVITGYDIQDEVNAYDVQHKIDSGIFFDTTDLGGNKVTGDDYKITPEEIWKNFPGVYDHFKPSK